MKKTSTRLATTTAVLLMSAFAIVLAQHDARKNSASKDENTHSSNSPNEPPMPLALDGWPGNSAVVRGNNNGGSDADLLGQSLENLNYENPLREESQGVPPGDLANIASQFLGSEVVTASGEFPTPPASAPSSATLQPLPQNFGDGFPSLSTPMSGPNSGSTGLPANSTFTGAGGPGNSLPSTNPIQQPASLPSTRPNAAPSGSNVIGSSPVDNGQPQPFGTQPFSTQSGNSSSSLGSATLGTPSTNGFANTALPSSRSNSASPSMSDTQRGAMLPTQLVDQPNITTPASTSADRPDNASSLTQPTTNNSNLQPVAPIADFSKPNLPPDNRSSSSPANASGNGGSSGSGMGANPDFANPSGFSSGSSAQGQGIFGATGASKPTNNEFTKNESTLGTRSTLVSNQPGSRYLDGSQNPVMQIHKRAPEEITVGKKTTFVITVRNASNATAHDVTVVDHIPRGVRFSDASPSVTPNADGLLTWKLGEMNAGEEKVIHLQVIPETEGEIGSVASVHFVAQASVRTMATAPKLEIQIDSSNPIIIGQTQTIPFTIRNLGSGVARGIRLELDVPPQLKHESGESELQLNLPDIRPNDSFKSAFVAAAVQPGQAVCPLRVVNDDGVQAENKVSVDVRAPQLTATISGPTRRYLQRQATYQVAIANPGTAVARNMDFDVHLPAGLKFVSADIPQATYHPESHSISLGLAELNPGSNGSFSITVLPIELGSQAIRLQAKGDLGISAEAKGQMVVEGLSELTFTIAQDNGTVEAGASTTYSVQISNVGNQSDKNVQLQVQIPEGAKLLKVDAPVDYREEPGRLTFAPIGEMRSRDVKTIRFQIQHNRAGNQVIRAQLTSTNWPVAVLKEEGTLVYNDQ
jgi:uncharacterized repeat protein (TIGR01451 family)